MGSEFVQQLSLQPASPDETGLRQGACKVATGIPPVAKTTGDDSGGKWQSGKRPRFPQFAPLVGRMQRHASLQRRTAREITCIAEGDPIMQVDEGENMLADAPASFFGKRQPTRTDVDVTKFEPRKKRRCVDKTRHGSRCLLGDQAFIKINRPRPGADI